jgi:hypothetical protein
MFVRVARSDYCWTTQSGFCPGIVVEYVQHDGPVGMSGVWTLPFPPHDRNSFEAEHKYREERASVTHKAMGYAYWLATRYDCPIIVRKGDEKSVYNYLF